MTNRWHVLALLFSIRTAMAFQFQSVAALAPLVRQDLGISIADIGLLIGIYLAPGIVFAVPGGAIGHRFGDKKIVLIGLALMIAGGLLMALSAQWSLQIAGRLLAGVGGVLLNVLMSKMVADWFAAREIATAMAIFVNSWAVGIALALVVLPPVATVGSLDVAYLLTTGMVAVGLLAFFAMYRPAARETVEQSGERAFPRGSVLVAVILAGLVWGLYSAGSGMVFAFGTSMLAERGWPVAAASSATSLFIWLAICSVPVGGFLADRSGASGSVLIGGLLGLVVMMVAAARMEAVLVGFALMGMVGGLSVGPIMSLPTRVLAAHTRAIGMGVFYTVYYIVVVLAPWVAGVIASLAGTTRVTFDFGAALLFTACLVVGIFYRIAGRIQLTAGQA